MQILLHQGKIWSLYIEWYTNDSEDARVGLNAEDYFLYL